MTDTEMIMRLKKIRENYTGKDDETLTWAIECIRFKRPHGEWTSNRHDLELFCSVCGGALPYSDEYTYETDFCPNCGASMQANDRQVTGKLKTS